MKTILVNKEYFTAENIIGQITEEKIDLNGVETLCYIIKTHSQATEHQRGPWCPWPIEEGMEKAGIPLTDVAFILYLIKTKRNQLTWTNVVGIQMT